MSIFSHAITMLVETVTKHHLDKATSTNIEADWRKDFTLRMQKAYNILGWICIGIAAFSIVPLMIEQPDNAYLLIVLPFLLLFFGGAGLLCILYYRNHYVVFDETYIIVSSPLKKLTTSRWDKIVKTKFNSTTGLLTLTDGDGQKLRVNQHLIGLRKFSNQLAAKTGLHTGIDH